MADQVNLSRQNSSSNMSDYDFCEEFDDLCDEFDDIEILSCSNNASVKTTHKSDFSDKLTGTVSGYFTEFNGNNSFISLSEVNIRNPDNILSFLPIKVSIKSLCNGLLLCYGRDYCYYICNPTTSEWKKLPKPTCQHGEDPAIVLAFLNSGAHYRLVCAVPDDLEKPGYKFETYSSETNSWKCSKEVFTGLKGVKIESKGYAFNCMVYWETKSDVVLGFDMKNEIPQVFYLKGLDDFVRARCIGSLACVKGEMCYLWASKFAGNILTFVETIVLVESMNSCRRPIMMDGEAFNIGKHELNEPCRVLPCVDEDNTMIFIGDIIYACSFHVNKRFKVVSRGCEFALGTKFFPYVNTLVSV